MSWLVFLSARDPNSISHGNDPMQFEKDSKLIPKKKKKKFQGNDPSSESIISVYPPNQQQQQQQQQQNLEQIEATSSDVPILQCRFNCF